RHTRFSRDWSSDVCSSDLRFFPLWVIPYRLPKWYPWLSPAMAAKIQDPLLIDCAIYGMPNGDPERDWSQVLEEQTYACDGVKTRSEEHTSELQSRENTVGR